MTPCRPILALACLLAGLALTQPLRAAQSQAVNHEATLGQPRIDFLDEGRVVISLDAVGELPGVISLTLEPAPAGGYTGTWAFMVAKVDNTDPATGLEPPPHEHHAPSDAPHAHPESGETANPPHRDYVRLVHRGDLSGAVTYAAFSYNDTGAADLYANLSITRGGLDFSGTTGTGTITLGALTLRY